MYKPSSPRAESISISFELQFEHFFIAFGSRLKTMVHEFLIFFTPNNFPFSRTSKQRLVDKPGFELIRPRAISVSIGFWHHNTS